MLNPEERGVFVLLVLYDSEPKIELNSRADQYDEYV